MSIGSMSSMCRSRTYQVNLVDVAVIYVLVDQQPLVLTKATSFKIHQVSVLHSCDEDNFIQELIHTLRSLDVHLLHRHYVSIR
jgi:hypothetical protein